MVCNYSSLEITMDNVETKSPIGEENNLILVILRSLAFILGNFVIFLKKKPRNVVGSKGGTDEGDLSSAC